MREPVLVASADGVGTKLIGRASSPATTRPSAATWSTTASTTSWCQGARPLFFLDYVGGGVLEPDATVALVARRARRLPRERLRAARRRDRRDAGLLPARRLRAGGLHRRHGRPPADPRRQRVRAGDVLVGLPSAGLHTNGYSLARRILFDRHRLGARRSCSPATDLRVGEALLAPHLSYLRALEPLLGHPGLHALAHITGGGLTDNLPRVLPAGTRGRIRLGSWEVPPSLPLAAASWARSRSRRCSASSTWASAWWWWSIPRRSPRCLRRLASIGGCPGRSIGTVEAGGAGIVYDRDERRRAG